MASQAEELQDRNLPTQVPHNVVNFASNLGDRQILRDPEAGNAVALDPELGTKRVHIPAILGRNLQDVHSLLQCVLLSEFLASNNP